MNIFEENPTQSDATEISLRSKRLKSPRIEEESDKSIRDPPDMDAEFGP